MSMIEHIQQYYLSERNGSVVAAIAGFALLLLSFLLWRFSDAGSISKGMAFVFLGAGLFFGVAGIAVTLHNTNKIAETSRIESPNDRVLQHSEIVRMDKVMDSAYTWALTLFSALVVAGLMMVLVTQQPVLKGIAVGLLITGTLGHTSEAFSMKSNGDYRAKINQLNFKRI